MDEINVFIHKWFDDKMMMMMIGVASQMMTFDDQRGGWSRATPKLMTSYLNSP